MNKLQLSLCSSIVSSLTGCGSLGHVTALQACDDVETKLWHWWIMRTERTHCTLRYCLVDCAHIGVRVGGCTQCFIHEAHTKILPHRHTTYHEEPSIALYTSRGGESGGGCTQYSQGTQVRDTTAKIYTYNVFVIWWSNSTQTHQQTAKHITHWAPCTNRWPCSTKCPQQQMVQLNTAHTWTGGFP